MTQPSSPTSLSPKSTHPIFSQPTQAQSEAINSLSKEIGLVAQILPEIKTSVRSLKEPFNQRKCELLRNHLDSEIARIAEAHLKVTLAFSGRSPSDEQQMLMGRAQKALKDLESLKRLVPNMKE
jgi:hypothetical protein